MNHCPICGRATAMETVFSTKSVLVPDGEEFSIGRCPECGVKGVMNVPGDLDRYYRTNFMKQNPGKVFLWLKKIALAREMKRLRGASANKLVVDLGCGIGDFSLMLHQNGFEAMTVDAEEGRPLLTKDIIGVPYYRIDYSDYEIMGFPRRNGGAVILRHVLEHIVDPFRFLNKLKEYGLTEFYIVLPNHDSWEEKAFGRYSNFYEPPYHLWFFNRSSLKMLLERAGLRTISCGFDTLPSVVPSIYRYFVLKGKCRPMMKMFHQQHPLNILCFPLNIFLPNNVLWVYGTTGREDK